MSRHLPSDARCAALLVLIATGGCRYEVQLDGQTDVALTSDVRLDAPPVADVPDALAPPDAPLLRRCEGSGVDLGPARALGGPGLGLARSRDGDRYALLVPPEARPAASDARLSIVDARGETLADRELPLGLGATVWSTSDGWLVLGTTEARVLDPDGAASGAPIALPEAPSMAWRHATGWIDATRLVYVGESGVLSVVDTALAEARLTTIDVSAEAQVLAHLGGVTVSHAEPTNETLELAPDLTGTVSLTVAWPDGPLAGRLLGVEVDAVERRWLVSDGEEFRNRVELHRLDAAGAPVEVLLGATVLAPLTAVRGDGLVAISAGDGTLSVFDLRSAQLTLVPGSPDGAVARDGEALAVLSIEPGPTTPALIFRCGVRP